MNNVFRETGVLDKQGLLSAGKLKYKCTPWRERNFKNKSYRTNGQNLAPITKGYLDFCFSFSLEQLNSIPTRITSKTATLKDHLLTNSSQKVSYCDVIELGVSNHGLVLSTGKKKAFA